MAKLQSSSIEELQKRGELPADFRKKIHQMNCDRVFQSYLQLFKQAGLTAADPETQYTLYFRCGELGRMIMQKNGFQQFAEKQKLGSTFKSVLSQMETLENMLTRGYEEKKTTVVAQPRPQAVVEAPKEIIKQLPKSKVTIQPRELLRQVEQEKKNAVILDFRADQSKKSIQYTKGAVTIISIPKELAKPGLIFGFLKQQLPVGQRALLPRLHSSDFVVIMEDEGSLLVNDEPQPSTAAGILKLALTEYNTHEKLKNAPIFMEGGFKSWMLQYPIYVHHADQDVALFHDDLESMISNYKRAALPFEYPELSPRRVAEKPAAVESIEPPLVIPPPPATAAVSLPQEVAGPVRPEPVRSRESATEGPSPVPQLPTVPERTTKPTVEPKPVSPLPSDSSAAQRLIGGHSAPDLALSQKENKIGQFVPPPTFDRTSKPEDVPQRPMIIPTSAARPSLDRTTKPGLSISAQEQRQLLSIYHMMAENIAQNAVRRGGSRPGQTGLYNMGNTCFMNACLQALFQTPGIGDTFSRDNFTGKINTMNPLGTRGVISAVFSAMLDNVWSGEFGAFKPLRFLGVFAKEVNSMLMNGQQQDASEFYMMFLASLHEDTNQVLKGTPPVTDYKGGANMRKEALDFDRRQSQYSISPISRILHPRTVTELTCSVCRAQSVAFDDVNIIQVGLPSPSMGRTSLVDCMHKSFSSTNLSDGWNCPNCKTTRSATQKVSLWKLSPVIVVHLLRFSFSGGDYVKNDISVVFDPDQLDMTPYLHASADRTADATYRLYSVTNHRGRLNSGHYTAVSRHLRTGEWLRYDDETVSAGRASDIDFSDAYILYFKRKGL